ncbi:MAG: prepilin peptidase [Alphaproteobacteria bacterium]|nr:prepilin peptidase [Alphaproteobacteria bacterium]
MQFLIEHQATIIGIIWMMVLGPAVGNYACSVVYRLPLGKTPFERHPYCGHCNADLKPIDLFPIVSFFLTGGKCRYCAGKIPSIYTVIELACLVLFITNFLVFGISETFLLYTIAGVFAIILAAIQYQQGWLSAIIYSYVFMALALERTRVEGTIYSWVEPSFIMLVICLLIEKIRSFMLRRPFKPFEVNWIWWPVLAATFA